MHSDVDSRNAERSTALSWDRVLDELREQISGLVDDFIESFHATEPYPVDQVAEQDIRETAWQTFDLLIRRLRGEPDPPGAVGAMERLAARRAQQGVPLSTFLRAVRIDFRVLWIRVQRIAGPEGSDVLAGNVVRLLDTVDEYVDSLREAYRSESVRINRSAAEQRHRAILRLFDGTTRPVSEIESLAQRLQMRAQADYEVVAVTGEGISAMNARYAADPRVGVFETASAMILFREQLGVERWRRDALTRGGYVGEVRGLGAVPFAGSVALEIARHAPAQPVYLATEDDVWATVARDRLESVFPRWSRSITDSLGDMAEHDRDRMLEAVRGYLASGSIKETAERLFCHRNTVINRLRAFSEHTGFDPTRPRDAAWIYVALADSPPN